MEMHGHLTVIEILMITAHSRICVWCRLLAVLHHHIFTYVVLSEKEIVDLQRHFLALEIFLAEACFLYQSHELFGTVFVRESLRNRVPSIVLFSNKDLRFCDLVALDPILFLLMLETVFWFATKGEPVYQLLKCDSIVLVGILHAKHGLYYRETVELLRELCVLVSEVYVELRLKGQLKCVHIIKSKES